MNLHHLCDDPTTASADRREGPSTVATPWFFSVQKLGHHSPMQSPINLQHPHQPAARSGGSSNEFLGRARLVVLSFFAETLVAKWLQALAW